VSAAASREPISLRLWMMLAAVVVAQAATTVVISAPAFLIPYFHLERGLSLASAGLLAGIPNFGLVCSLVLWGIATDRFGERRVMLIGLIATAATVAISAVIEGLIGLGIVLALSGALSACTNSASGRLISGWFPADRRGLAMGIRQTCQPLGIAIAAVCIPPLAAFGGLPFAFGFGGVLVIVGLLACAILVHDPAHPRRGEQALGENPYRGSAVLVRIHVVSILLVVPQTVLSTFGLVWFTVDFGWSALAAGSLIAASQFCGAGCRILVGVWSDLAGSRLRPLRIVAWLGVATLLACAAFGWLDWSVPAAAAFVVASCVSVADNGLAFTSIAELAGHAWSGRALSIQNTGQYLGVASVGPVFGAVIGVVGIPAALAISALAPVLAAPFVPSPRVEHVRV